MELQTLGARILASFLFISILLLEALPAAAAVSRNNNGVKAASAYEGKILVSYKNGITAVNRNDNVTTTSPANKGKTAIGKTKSSANHGNSPIGKKMGSANRGKKVVPANHGKTPMGKTTGSANRSKKKVFTNRGKTVVFNNNNGKTEAYANHGGEAVALKINRGIKAGSTNNGGTAVSQNEINNLKTISVANNGETPLSQNNGITSGPMKQQQQQTEQFTPEFNWEQQQYLKAHNDLRQKNGIPPLKWDAGLTAHARSWAMERRKDCKYRDHSNSTYGENSFWMQYKDFNPTDVVQNWFSEKELFDHTRNVCKCEVEKEDCECGHYLNVIGKTTTKVGCSGYVYCSNQKGVIVYCSYFPPTNYYPRLNPKNPPPAAARRLLSFI